ncbi:MAG: acyl--CoA ligase, partial [Proteobacteria bacterium]|nr:acyl--CoA ligase [Pseudomonadota bacterium]
MAKPTRFTPDMIEDYIARGFWDELSIQDLLRRNAEQSPDKEALVDSNSRFTWSELDRITDRVAFGLLESGMKRDGALVAQLPSSANTLILLLACHKAGILCCFPPMTFRHLEIKHLLRVLEAEAVLTPGMYRKFNYSEMVRQIAPDLPRLRLQLVLGEEAPQGTMPFSRLCATDPGGRRLPPGQGFGPFDVSMVVLSSGSTGMPKCIEYTPAAFKAAGRGVILRAGLGEEDVFAIIAPLSGGPGLQSWWGALQLGCKVCLLEHFSPRGVLELIQKERVTFLSAVPTQLVRILNEADPADFDLRSLRVIRTGASAFDASLARETEIRMKCKVVIAGGSQETHSFGQSSVEDPDDLRISTEGKPFPGNEIRIADDNGCEMSAGEIGHLWVRGAATSSGYYQNGDETLAAWGEFGKEGWFRTGDLARVDEQGYLTLVGRKKEMILRGGQNIYPKEIEEMLLSHPRVRQAVVIGIPDPVMGERACACVTVVQGQPFTFEEMT